MTSGAADSLPLWDAIRRAEGEARGDGDGDSGSAAAGGDADALLRVASLNEVHDVAAWLAAMDSL